MKRFTAIIVLVLAVTSAWAQENQIKRIPKRGVESTESKNLTDYDRGFWFGVDLSGGYSVRTSDPNMGYGELDVTAGYRFNDYLRIGPGFGARYYFTATALRCQSSRVSFPIYMSVRGNIIKSTYRDVVPYYSFDIGGAVYDGFMMRPTIGLRIGGERHAFILGLSYVGQTLRGYGDMTTLTGKSSRFVSFLSLRLGYEF